MFKNLFKPKRVRFLGEFTDAFFTTLPFFGLYSALSLTVILYAETSKWLIVWMPWMNLWVFIFMLTFILSIISFLAYKYVVPSLWNARSKRMDHLENKLDLILDSMGLGKRKGKKVAVSGGFDPIHKGHVRYIKEAMGLGNWLIVILTRDDQLEMKKSKAFMGYEERKEILEAMIGKNGEVVPNVDSTIASVESIRKYKPDIFAKGGDTWDADNLPETDACKELGIEIVFGIGGFDKAQSSSWLTDKK